MGKFKENTTKIDQPSPKMLDLVRGLKKRKEETQKKLNTKAKFFFPKTDS